MPTPAALMTELESRLLEMADFFARDRELLEESPCR
jgi:hypothetical protein